MEEESYLVSLFGKSVWFGRTKFGQNEDDIFVEDKK